MDSPEDLNSSPAESKSLLPDVVHSQQSRTVETCPGDSSIPLDSWRDTKSKPDQDNNKDSLREVSETESISEHLPSNIESSVTEADKSEEAHGSRQSSEEHERVSIASPVNELFVDSLASDHITNQDLNQPSTSWALDAVSELQNESPLPLPLSSDKDIITQDSEPLADKKPSISTKLVDLDQGLSKSPKYTSSRSLQDEVAHQKTSSSSSEEIIELDIRKKSEPLYTSKIIYHLPHEGPIDSDMRTIPDFKPLLSPFIITSEGMNIKDVLDNRITDIDLPSNISNEQTSLLSNRLEQSDLLVEEIIVQESKEQDNVSNNDDQASLKTQPKSLAPEETMSFCTSTTDYKTICEEFNVKLVHLEDVTSQQKIIIEDLKLSLQETEQERDNYKADYEQLQEEVCQLQQRASDHSDPDTVKGQLSDFIKYTTMTNESTRYYSACTHTSRDSPRSSESSKGDEKDNDREEITVNHSCSDLRDSNTSGEYQIGVGDVLSDIIEQYGEAIEDNLRNKLKESVTQLFNDEFGKLRIEYDTELKEIEHRMTNDKQAFNRQCSNLRNLLSSVKSGNADIQELRQELGNKHKKDMEELRTYFEKKCSDFGESFTRTEGAVVSGGAGDYSRRSRSVDLHEPDVSQCHNCEQELEKLRSEHETYVTQLKARHRDEVKFLREKFTMPVATEAVATILNQDIDLELEKERRQSITEEVTRKLEEQILVLLSNPDAESSSWPPELLAVREKIYHDIVAGLVEGSEKEDSPVGESGKWRQRRNYSFDQNRHLEEITKERDSFQRLVSSLQRAVTQIVSYCGQAEDELNRTVLANLLTRIATDSAPDDSPNVSLDISTVSTRRVHFAPTVSAELAELLGDAGAAGWLRRQGPPSLDLTAELDLSMARLRLEAQELLDLSCRVAKNQNVNESVQITELVEGSDFTRHDCDKCRPHQKDLEEALSECLHREKVLRGELEAALMKISHFMTDDQQDVIAEGYGQAPRAPLTLPARRLPSPATDSRSVSLDATPSPRQERDATRLALELDAAHRERDDLQQQLESANRQLRSTKQFVEEQAAEREAERDESARLLEQLRNEKLNLERHLQTNARIMNEVEQLENQAKDMNQIICELEANKFSTDNELKATADQISLLQEVIANLESQLNAKTAHESEILVQLEQMKKTIDERDSKMRALLGELESLRSERVDNSDVRCVRCSDNYEDSNDKLMQKINEQSEQLELWIHRRSSKLERVHEECSTCSEPSEDVSLRDQRREKEDELLSPERSRVEWTGGLGRVWDRLATLSRAEDAALKRMRDLEMQRDLLKNVTQELRAERDVLQTRMSEQALKLSSLSARLEQERSAGQATRHDATSRLVVQLHDATAEVQRLTEELETKEKQLVRLKQSVDERDKHGDDHDMLYGNSCNPKDKVIILERELSSAQSRIAQLEAIAKGLETDKNQLQHLLKDQQRQLAEKHAQLQELLELKLDDEGHKTEQKSELAEGKNSARTLSDIVSISDYDEQDIQMRRAELKHNQSVNAAFSETKEKTFNRTLLPNFAEKHHMSSLVDYTTDYVALHEETPRAESLPVDINTPHSKDLPKNYKRNVNETTVFGTLSRFGNSAKHSTAHNIPDNTSMYPNREVSIDKNATFEPKRINFSIEPSNEDNRLHEEEEFTSLRELGIVLDIKQQNFPDILSQLKHEIKKSHNELKRAEEQLCEFGAVKDEVEELKTLLENTTRTMDEDKKYYNNQLDKLTSNKKLLEQRLAELTQDADAKLRDLHLCKEEMLRRETIIMELVKKKRNLTTKLTELEHKVDELQTKNNTFSSCDVENKQMRKRMNDLEKLEQVVLEKDQQIDSLNMHLNRLDNLQRSINDKSKELDNLKQAYEEKSTEIFHLQDSIEALNKDLSNATEENEKLIISNKDLTHKLTKIEKEQENTSIKLKSNESEVVRLNEINKELASKLSDMKTLTDNLKDKDCEIEILNEDINSFHDEIAILKEQLMMVSRSPSPKTNKQFDEKVKSERTSNDKKQLVKIRRQISLLQHNLDCHKKELIDKTFELSKAKLDITELKNNNGQIAKQLADRDINIKELTQDNTSIKQEMRQLQEEKESLKQKLEILMERIREEGNLEELQEKLREKIERCVLLEREMEVMRDALVRSGSQPSGQLALTNRATERSLATRSPTAELESAVRAQLDYSHQLDDDIMHQILSSSSDMDMEEIPRLALDSSNRSSSSSMSPDKLNRLRSDNDKLQMQVDNLEARLKDKDALIAELHRIRDKLVNDWESARLKYEAEKDNSGRLQLLLDSHKESAENWQNQDSNVISTLKKRLERSMQSEVEVQQALQQAKSRVNLLERRLLQAGDVPLSQNTELLDQLRGEVTLLKSKLDLERNRYLELQSSKDQQLSQLQRELNANNAQTHQLKIELAETKRLKHECNMELIRAKELLNAQKAAVTDLENRLAAGVQRENITDALNEFSEHKSALSREIATLTKTLQSNRDGRVGQHTPRPDTRPDHDAEHTVRYLHTRVARLESCRKALVWQKRYLQRVLAGYAVLESRPQVAPVRRFKCVALCVVVLCRMGYLVRRRHAVRALSGCLLSRPQMEARPVILTPVPTSPPCRDHTEYRSPATRRDLRLNVNNMPSPQLDELLRRSTPRSSRGPQEHAFILSGATTPRETAACYLRSLDNVTHSLHDARGHTLHDARGHTLH